jgi:hypothetical protein
VKSIVRCCAVLLLTVAGLTGCRTDEPPAPTFTNWPQSLADFRFRWAAEPGVDLVSGPAVPLRAYLESYRIAELTREIGDVYPGFERAVPQLPSDSDAPAQLLSIRPSFEGEPFGPPGPFFGNEFFRDGKEEDEGKYVSVVGYRARTGLGDVNGMKVWRVEFTDSPPAADAPAKVTDQSGPNPAPAGDVFGPWRITGANDVIWGSMVNRESTADERVDGAQRLSQCSDLLPHWRTERDANIRAALDAPPAPEPASPGWPEATA